MKSSLGPQLQRMELYAFDSNGKRVPRLERGLRVVLVRESRSYYDNPDAGSEDEAALEDGGIRARLASLTEEEYRCLQLVEARGQELDRLVDPSTLESLMPSTRVREERVIVARRDEETRVAEGWLLVKRVGRVSHLVKNYSVQLGYEQVARVMGLSVEQVRRRVLSGYRKLGPANSYLEREKARRRRDRENREKK